ncbi:triphosphoribosyl-dephospho-CoA synthase [Paraburkholderia kururiensis]|uniref:Probable 2-(5''-triphosphoribosyl)-3'-dephosphocoenzyme-A synthase n=1 Tax=Paraburkholderia kururiensis TaxID=984307 RepID=A0ABZ0WKG3_9BURK|nr:triphosphoribosyl-dephospho-CoA synthase [Paraburkholderia kururiensis]WQD77839.1 triphosphoribosyl-dephospho-CoA synthase [Paraburkholderia kururiensis]
MDSAAVGCGCTESSEIAIDATAGNELARTQTLLTASLPRETDALLARLAVEALVDEALLTPKPALVDTRGSGAHRDLNLATMLRSAHTLAPTFAALARAALTCGVPSAAMRTELARIGRHGEAEMLRATGGSNAHRGAIWIVGLLVAGAAIDSPGVAAHAAPAATHAWPNAAPASCAFAASGARRDVSDVARGPSNGPHDHHHAHAARICALAAQIAAFPDLHAVPTNSNGERVRARFQVGGARREAQDGFPHVIDIGLPALGAARARGIGESAARLDTLLAIMASLDDTCLLHRAGLAGLEAGRGGAQRVLDLGGSATLAGRAALAVLERRLLDLNASPGGAADLLAATLFIDRLVRHRARGRTSSWNN